MFQDSMVVQSSKDVTLEDGTTMLSQNVILYVPSDKAQSVS